MKIFKNIGKRRLFSKQLSCQLTSTLHTHFKQAIEENEARINHLVNFRDPDIAIWTCLYQKLMHLGDQNFTPNINLLNRLNQTLPTFFDQKNAELLNESTADELIITAIQLVHLKQTFDKDQDTFLVNTLKSVYTIYGLLNKEIQDKLASLLQHLEAKYLNSPKTCSSQLRKQILVGKELKSSFHALSYNQRQSYFQDKLELSQLLKTEKNIEIVREGDMYILSDKKIGHQFNLFFASNYEQESQFDSISEYLGGLDNLENLMLDYQPALLKEITHKNMNPLDNLEIDLLEHWNHIHTIKNKNFNDFYIKTVLDKEMYVERSGRFYQRFDNKVKGMDFMISILADFLLKKKVQGNYNITLAGHLQEELLLFWMKNLDYFQAKYINELSSLLNLINFSSVYTHGHNHGCVCCGGDPISKTLKLEDVYNFTSKIYQSQILDYSSLKEQLIPKIMMEMGTQLPEGSISHGVFSNIDTKGILQGYLNLNQHTRLSGFQIDKFKRGDISKQLKKGFEFTGDDDSLMKLIYLEVAFGLFGCEKNSFYGMNKDDFSANMKYHTTLDTINQKMSVENWNPRFLDIHQDDFPSSCEPDQINDFSSKPIPQQQSKFSMNQISNRKHFFELKKMNKTVPLNSDPNPKLERETIFNRVMKTKIKVRLKRGRRGRQRRR